MNESNRKALFRSTLMVESFLAVMLQDMQYSEGDEACSEEREERDVGTIYTCPDATLGAVVDICERFHAAALSAPLVDGESLADAISSNDDQAGSDLYLEMAGHGAGFRDRDCWDDDADINAAIGEALSALVDGRSTLETYLGDDGRAYIFGRERGPAGLVALRYKAAGECVYGGTEPIGEALARSYRFWRERGLTVAGALVAAQSDSRKNVRRWPARGRSSIGKADKDGARWVEQPETHGLRHANDTVNRWYLADDGWTGETARGEVYRMAHGRYVPAVSTSNDDNGALFYFADTTDNEGDALHYAGAMAEAYAERERDYQRAWQEGREAGEAASECSESFMIDNPDMTEDDSAEAIAERKAAVINPYSYEPEASAWQEGFDNA